MHKRPLCASIHAHNAVSQTPRSGTFVRSRLRRVLVRPDPTLARRAREIDPRAPGLIALADELVTTMRASPACVGLAATQVGETIRMFCIDVTGHRKTRSCAGLVVMVNPQIVSHAGAVTMREGCMSVPDLTGDVTRAAEVMVEGFEPGSTRVVRIVADAFEARCLQHEIDHLDGFVFVDRINDPSKHLFARKTYA